MKLPRFSYCQGCEHYEPTQSIWNKQDKICKHQAKCNRIIKMCQEKYIAKGKQLSML